MKDAVTGRLMRRVEASGLDRHELFNAVTHGLGLVLSIAGLGVLLTTAAMRGRAEYLIAAGVFGTTLVFMYLASTLYHGFRVPHLKRLMRVVDHIAIYLLIAGTYTPFLLLLFPEAWRWKMMAIVWAMALAGTIFKLFTTGRYERLSTGLYLAMGWLVVVGLRPLLQATPPGGLAWLIAGGLLYTVGTAFFAWERLPYNHAIWHLFVLGGSACHFYAVVYYALA